MPSNTLYYGDNLDVLRRHVADESVDLVYLDPPFNSKATYNVLFAERDGSQSAAQITAFDDFWHWDEAAADAYHQVVETGGRAADALRAFRDLLGDNDMLAYLAMMAPRLVELRRVMKPTASIYLHCDPTASHHLKVLMDAVFGAENFRNEIVWKRTHSHGGARRYGPVHDTILFYTLSGQYIWNPQHTPYSEQYKERFFRFRDDDGRRYRLTILTGSGIRGGQSGQPWRGVNPTDSGRHWAIPGYVRELLPDPDAKTQDALDQLDALGRVHWPASGEVPSFVQYLDDMPGVELQDIWSDIAPISAQAAERLGYPTQKPEELLERIIAASSNEGDLVLDPFCGCGTTVVAAQRLHRRWIGIDVTHLAVGLMRTRLRDTFGEHVHFTVVGEPVSLPDAEALAASDPYQFQWWALSLVGARPAEQKKGADRGIDGRRYFHDDAKGATKQIIFSVKAGHTGAAHVRDLVGVLDREKAQIGVLLSFQEPTQPMRSEAASAGFYESPLGTRHPRVQLVTVGELLDGRQLDLPRASLDVTLRRAPRAQGERPAQGDMFEDVE